MTMNYRILFCLALLGDMCPRIAAAKVEPSAALEQECGRLIAEGDDALLSQPGVEPAFSKWRQAVRSCPTDGLDPLVAARLRSAQSLLPEYRAGARQLLDEAVALLDEENLDHADALAGVLRRRMLLSGEQGNEAAVAADLATIERILTARHGSRSPEALKAHLNTIADRARTANRAGKQEELARFAAEIERLLQEAHSGGYLSRDVALLAHSEAKQIYESLGSARAAEEHALAINRLEHSLDEE